MSALPPKQRVRDAFDRAASSYDAAAVVQREVCARLLDRLAEAAAPARIADTAAFDLSAAPRILDAGCGTGYGARLLRERWPRAQITAADFAPAMLALARRHADRCLAADIEALPLPDGAFDLWWSSLSIQWCDAAAVFAEAARVLRPGGRLAVSTLAPGTFGELRTAFAGVDRYRHTIAFSEPDSVGAALSAAGFRAVELRRATIAVHYPDLKALLRAVKAIGANAVGDGARSGMMGRAAWQAVQAAYESRRTAAGLPASYDVLLCTAEK